MRVDVTLLNRLMNLVGELVLTRNQVLRARSTDPKMTLLSRRLDMDTADLRESGLKAHMQPVSNVLSRMPRMVRDPEIRGFCNFRQANLCQSPLPFQERFDVIFLRNFMLYFSQVTRRTLLTGILRLLAPDEVLFLGSAEQPADPTLWHTVLAGGTCYFRPRTTV